MKRAFLPIARFCLWTLVATTAPLRPPSALAEAARIEEGTPFSRAVPRYGLSADDPVHAAYVVESVRFRGSEGDVVTALLYTPAATRQARHRAVILQHGLNSDKNSDYIRFHAMFLASKDFVVLAMDAPGRGDRPSLLPTQTAFNQVPRFVRDYKQGLDYLIARRDVDPVRVGFIGISWGAVTGLTYSALDPRVKAMTSVVGGAGMSPWVPWKWDPIHYLNYFATKPLYLINARYDAIMGQKWSQTLHQYAPASAKHRWLMSNHFLVGVDMRSLNDDIAGFMRQSLDNATPRH